MTDIRPCLSAGYRILNLISGWITGYMARYPTGYWISGRISDLKYPVGLISGSIRPDIVYILGYIMLLILDGNLEHLVQA